MRLALFNITLMLITFSAQASEVILIGDQGKNNPGQAEVAQALKEHCALESCQLGILAGDNVYEEGVTSDKDPILETMFDKFYNPLKIPFLVALGNHDYGKYARDWVRGDWQLLHTKKNPNFFAPHFWYSYETPDTILTIIDTSRLMHKKDHEVQAKLVEEAFRKAKTAGKWFVVVGHHPYLSNGKHGNAGNYDRLKFPASLSGTNVKKFLNEHVCGKAQFYMSGHDHNLQIFDGNIAQCNTQLIVSGSAGNIAPLKKRNAVLFENAILGFFKLSITSTEFRVRAMDSKLNVLFEKKYLK